MTLLAVGEGAGELTITGLESVPIVAAGAFVYGVAVLSRPDRYQEPTHVPTGDISSGIPKPYIPNDLAKKLAAAAALAVAGEKTLEELIPGSLKRSPSWHQPYASKTPSEIRELAKKGDQKAKKMKKLLDQVDRLLDKNKNK